MEKELIRRYFNDTATQEERELVDRWLLDSSLREEVLSVIGQMWKEEGVGEMPPPPFDEVLKRAMEQDSGALKVAGRRGRILLWVGTAAACAIFLVAGVGIGYNMSRKNISEDAFTQLSPVINGSDGPSVVMLSNGAEVVLNCSSRLMVDEENDDIHQTVYLEGEATFNLRDKNKPLVIKTRDIVATATGSQFNISASPADSVVKVTVSKGKAEVKPNTEKYGPLLKLRIPAKKDSAALADSGVMPKTMPLIKLRPVIVKEKEQMTFNKNNGSTDIGLNTQDSTTIQP